MPPLKLTSGVEAEYFLASHDYDVAPPEEAIALIKAMKLLGPAAFDTEYHTSIVEARTAPHATPGETIGDLRRHRDELIGEAERRRLRVFAAGTHPRMQWRDERRVPNDSHYNNVAEITPYNGMRYAGCGLQIHIGAEELTHDRDLLVRILDEARHFLPYLVALTVDAPLWNGTGPTGFLSYRVANLLVGEEPMGGMLNTFGSYPNYQAMRDQMMELMPSIRVNADLRVNDKFQTLEFRVMDMIPSLADTEILIAVCMALVETIHRRLHNETMPKIHLMHTRMNRWIAAKDGTRAEKFIGLDGVTTTWGVALGDFLDFILPTARDLRLDHLVEKVPGIVPAGFGQIDAFNTSVHEYFELERALRHTVRWLVEETTGNNPAPEVTGINTRFARTPDTT